MSSFDGQVTEKHHMIFPIATAFIEGYSKKIFCTAASSSRPLSFLSVLFHLLTGP
jgi:hypothetical protein